LTRPAVSAIVDELIADGLVRELGPGRSTGGKPPIMLEFVPSSRCAIGINLGGDGRIEGVLCDLSCEVLFAESIAYKNDFEDILQVTGKVIRLLKSKVADSAVIAGVGVAVSGIVDENGGVMCSPLDIVGKALLSKLQDFAGVPVRLERRPNAAALAEALFGAGSGSERLMYLTSGVGVGAGFVISGEIFGGSHGCAGEVGGLHLPDGQILEEAARPRAMLGEYAKCSGTEVDFETFLQRYMAGEKVAVELVEANAELLAYAASTAANLFDPDAVVLGGDALEFGEKYFEVFQKAFVKRSIASELGREPKILRSTFGRRGVAVGGAQIILDSLVG
jgi:predicted NBD/HSP70 family sugar kinase